MNNLFKENKIIFQKPLSSYPDSSDKPKSGLNENIGSLGEGSAELLAYGKTEIFNKESFRSKLINGQTLNKDVKNIKSFKDSGLQIKILESMDLNNKGIEISSIKLILSANTILESYPPQLGLVDIKVEVSYGSGNQEILWQQEKKIGQISAQDGSMTFNLELNNTQKNTIVSILESMK